MRTILRVATFGFGMIAVFRTLAELLHQARSCGGIVEGTFSSRSLRATRVRYGPIDLRAAPHALAIASSRGSCTTHFCQKRQFQRGRRPFT